MFAQMKTTTRLLLSFGVIVALLFAVASAAVWGLRATESDLRQSVEQHVAGVTLSQHVLSQLDTIGLAMRDVALAADDSQRERALARIGPAREQMARDFETLRGLSLDTEGRALVASAYEGLNRNATQQARFLELLAQQETAQAVDLLKGQIAEQQASYRAQLMRLVEYEEAALAKATETVEQRVERLTTLTMGLSAAALLIAVAVTTLMTRWLSRLLGGEPAAAQAVATRVAACDLRHDVTLRQGDEASVIAAIAEMQLRLRDVVSEVRSQAEEVATTSAQIAQATLDLSQRTETQASNLEETAASMEQLTATVRQNADSAQRAASSVDEARASAEHGGRVMHDVVERMAAITGSARRIEEIIGVIDGIAFQTNILALNAAVEAARAGEQGRGFAVVATEVRTLAQRSAHAAKEIKQLIENSLKEVEAGSGLVQQAGTSVSDIVAQVKHVSTLIADMAHASQEQAEGVQQVGHAIVELDQVTQQNAALVEESSAACDNLRQQAQRLTEMVRRFQLPQDALAAAGASGGTQRPGSGTTARHSGRLASPRPAVLPRLPAAA